MKNLLLSLIFLTCSNAFASRTLYSIADGQWDDPYVWITDRGIPSVPSPDDHIVISHEIIHIVHNRDTYTHRGNVLIEAEGSYFVNIGKGMPKAYIFQGELFEVYGALVTSDDFSHQKGVPDGNGVFHAYSGATIFIGDDYEPHERSVTINDVDCFVMGDDLKFFGDKAFVCGEGRVCIGPFTDIPGTANGEVRAIVDGRHVSGFDFLCTEMGVYRMGEDGGYCAEFVQNGNNPFPVEMLSFDAEQTGDFVDVSWATATELNNHFFTLERSTNLEDFRPIGMMEGAGTTDDIQTYQFTDRNPVGGKVYYRLKQTDFDGTSSYSNTIEINVRISVIHLSTYPNPLAGNTLNLNISGTPKHTPMRILIRDIMGKVIMQTQVRTDYDGNLRQEINITNLPRGQYILTCQFAGRQMTKKILRY